MLQFIHQLPALGLVSLGDALEVCIKAVSNRYIATIIDVERRVNVTPFTNVSDELLQDELTAFCPGLVGRIIW